MRHCLAITLTLYLALPGIAATFYLDLVNGSLNNPGTLAAPWPSLEEVIQEGLVETQKYAPLPYDPANRQLIPKIHVLPCRPAIYVSSSIVIRTGSAPGRTGWIQWWAGDKPLVPIRC